MVSDAGPTDVLLTGENNYMRLHDQENGPMTTRAAHWRVLVCPGGPGHVLFLKSDVTLDEIRIYSDNIAMTRWLQEVISNRGEFADQDILVIDAVFSRSGDATHFWTEHVDTEEETIAMTWFDFGKPFVTGTPAGSSPDRPLGWTSIFVPARRVQLTLNGTAATGRAFPEQRGDNISSTAGLALSESWFQPRS